VATLIREGRVVRAYLGVVGGSRPLAPRRADEVGQPRGIGVNEIVTGSPAERAGIRPTDTILTVDGAPIEDVGDLQRRMTAGAIGRTLHLRVLRGDHVVELDVVPVELT
jgi:S1-C subfamily serine protease